MSMLVNKNITIEGLGRTSMRLEPDGWEALEEICHRENTTLSDLVTRIDREHGMIPGERSSAVRMYALRYFRAAATDDGHKKAGHGRYEPNGVAA